MANLTNDYNGNFALLHRGAPPAPRKVRKENEDSSPSEIVHYFPEGPAPGAPVARRTRTIKLSMLPEEHWKLAAKDIATKWLPLFEDYAIDGDYDGAAILALDESMKVTPMSLEPGPYQNIVITFSCTSFEYDIQEIWIDRSFSDGKFTKVTVCVQGENVYGAPGLKREYKFDLDNIRASSSVAEDTRKDHGHWEVAGTGKNFHKIWVTAPPSN